MALNIDGKTVSQACAAGGCGLSFGAWPMVNMSEYDGGAHPAELVATDGAGNVFRKAWTINVDPSGYIDAEEAEDTLAALEATEPETAIITPTDEVISEGERAEGNDPALSVIGSAVTVEGVPVESEFTTSPGDGIVIPTPEGEMEVQPVGEAGPEETVISDEIAAVTPNTAPHVDTIVRPEYDGVTAFQTIRDAKGPEDFSWQIKLYSGQYMEQVDDQTVMVRHIDDSPAMTIRAEQAHDATGAAVVTTLSAEETNVITLHVQHKGQPLVTR